MKAFRLLWTFLGYEQKEVGRVYTSWNDLDDGFLSRLIAWMSNADVSPKLSVTTKVPRYRMIRAFFEWVKMRGLLPNHWLIRRNPWPLNHRETKSRDALSEAELAPIIRAAVQDIERTTANWARARAILEDPSIVVPSSSAKISAYKNPAVALKALATAFPEGAPRLKDVKKRRKGLSDAFRTYAHLSYINAIEALFPTPRLLVPFVVLIAQMSLFNPDTILRLRWSEIEEEHPVYGSDRWRLRGHKPRARKRQMRSFPTGVKHLTNPVVLLQILRRQTVALRDKLPREVRDYVFVFRTEISSKAAGTFAESDFSRTTWNAALHRFIAQYQLTPFTLANLRMTGADFVDELTEGDIKAKQELLNHVNPETTERSYSSRAARVRLQEKLAHAMAWSERYARSGGKIDSRGKLGSHRAATPGYECFDPYDSPQPGQVSGRLCIAYGCCPGCALHALNFRSPISLGRVIQLAARLDEASEVLDPQRWLSQWMPIQKAVRMQLRLFADDIYRAARGLQLSPIPEIE